MGIGNGIIAVERLQAFDTSAAAGRFGGSAASLDAPRVTTLVAVDAASADTALSGCGCPCCLKVSDERLYEMAREAPSISTAVRPTGFEAASREMLDQFKAAVPGGALGAATFDQSLSGAAAIDALLAEEAWDVSALTYSFPTLGSQYEPAYSAADEPHSGFAKLGAAYKTALRGVYENNYGALETVIDMGFSEAGTPGGGDLRSAYSTDPGVAYCYLPHEDPLGGDSWYKKSYLDPFGAPTPGTYVYATLVHENGHAMGLKHAHETPFGISGTVMPAALDTLEYTIMTYRSYVGQTLGDGYVNEDGGFPTTYMILDLAALQWLYGADFTTNATDSVYTWNATTGQMSINGVGQVTPADIRVFMTVWDGGGIDTYNLSNYADGTLLDLRPGAYCGLDVDQLAHLNFYEGGTPIFARGNVFNAVQYFGSLASLIENGIGGAGADLMIGNQIANALTGGAGNDVINGNEGNDVLTGDAGKDKMNGGTNNDLMTGGLANDKLTGGGGHDTLIGGAGADTHKGSGGNDVFKYSLIGDCVGDSILGLAAGDTINLVDIDANANKAGNQAFTLVGAFSGKGGQAVLALVGGNTELRLDTDGDSLANAVIFMSGDQTAFGGLVL